MLHCVKTAAAIIDSTREAPGKQHGDAFLG